MGQLIRMNNAKNVDIAVNIKKYLQITSTGGVTAAAASNYTQYPTLCFQGTWGTTYTSSDYNGTWLFPYASSDSDIPASQTAITNQIGNCSITYTAKADNTGWIANITITGSGLQDETVNSIMFTRRLYVQGGGTQEFLLFAYILDSPITLNADNNYTANLTMSVSFE